MDRPTNPARRRHLPGQRASDTQRGDASIDSWRRDCRWRNGPCRRFVPPPGRANGSKTKSVITHLKLMKTGNRFSRREFLTRTSAAVSALPVLNAAIAFAEAPANKRYRIVGFSKPFQTLNFEETAELVEQVGWDGIECAARQKGHVLPERVEDD